MVYSVEHMSKYLAQRLEIEKQKMVPGMWLLNFTPKRYTVSFKLGGISHMCDVYTHTHLFNSPFSRITQVSQYQKGRTNLDFSEARDSEWQWHQLGHMQVCTSLQTDNYASTPPLSFYRPDAFPAAQPTASKH